MLKINLLPWREMAREQTEIKIRRKIVLFVFIVIIAPSIIFVVVNYYLCLKIKEKVFDNHELKSKINSLENQIKKHNNKQIETISNNIAVINNLIMQSREVTDFFQILQANEHMESDGTNLKTINFTHIILKSINYANNTFTLIGSVGQLDNIIILVKNIHAIYKNVQLIEITSLDNSVIKDDTYNSNLHDFKLNFISKIN